MPLPICQHINEWEVEKIINSIPIVNIGTNIRNENPILYKLLMIARKYEQDEVVSSYWLGASIIYSLLSDAAKPNKLPVVSQATMDSTIVSFFSDDKNKKGTDAYRKMFKDRTFLLIMLYVIETDKLSEIEKDWIAKGAAQFYEILYRQAEADDMEELFQ